VRIFAQRFRHLSLEEADKLFDEYLERIPVTFEHSPRAERSSCILVG